MPAACLGHCISNSYIIFSSSFAGIKFAKCLFNCCKVAKQQRGQGSDVPQSDKGTDRRTCNSITVTRSASRLYIKLNLMGAKFVWLLCWPS